MSNALGRFCASVGSSSRTLTPRYAAAPSQTALRAISTSSKSQSSQPIDSAFNKVSSMLGITPATEFPQILDRKASNKYSLPVPVDSNAASSTPPSLLRLPLPQDPLLTYMTSLLLHDGLRHKAAQQTARTLEHIHLLTRAPPLPILREAVRLVSPSVRVVTQRKRAKNLQTPHPLNDKQRARYAIKWILKASEKRGEKKVEQRVAMEMINVLRGESEALKRKQELHRLAVANRANAQVRV